MLGFGKKREAPKRRTPPKVGQRFDLTEGLSGQKDLFGDVRKTPRTFAGEYRKYIQRVWGATTHLAQSNHYCRAALLLMLKNVIGQGLTLRANLSNVRKKQQIEARWRKWKRKNGFAQLELETLWSFLVYGEAFIMIAPNADGGLRLTSIAAPRLRPDLDRKTYRNNNILADNKELMLGVEMTGDRIDAYHFLTKVNESSINLTYASGGKTVRVPADMILHVFLKLDPEAIRGWPWFAPGIQSFLGLDKFNKAELTSSIIASSMFGIASPAPEDNTDYTGQGASDAADDEEQEETITLSPTPGKVLVVDKPINLQTFQPEHPQATYDAFMERETSVLAASMGLASFEVSSNLKGISYSSGRLGNLQAHESYVFIRNIIVEKLHRPVFERWLEMERNAGNLPRLSESEFEDLMESKFVGKAPKFLDPVKEATSIQRRIRSGVTSWQEALEAEGKDPTETMELIKQSKEMFESNDLIEVWNAIFQVKEETAMEQEEVEAEESEQQSQPPQPFQENE